MGRLRKPIASAVRFLALLAVLAMGVLAIIATSGGGDSCLFCSPGAPVTMNLTATVRTPSQVEISWTPHPEPVLGYDLFRNGSAAWPTHLSGTSFSDRNLDPATQYCYQVNAVQFLLGVIGTSNVACATTFTTAPWSLTVIDTSGGEYVSLVLDPGGTLHIGYYDSSASALKYATSASGSWVTAVIDSGATGFGGTSIALDAGGAVHMSYNDYDPTTGGSALKYATNASGTWVTALVDSAGGWANSIALDAAGGVHISYMTSSPSPALRYATNASGSWLTTFLAGFSANIHHSSIAIDSAAAVHIGYAVGNGVCAVRYATNASGAWTDSVLADSTRCGASLAVDSTNGVHISYMVSFDLIYATNASGGWVSTSVDRFDWIPGEDISITVDSGDRIHLSYQDHNADLKYATNTSGAWVTEWIDSKGSVGSYSSLGVDLAGRVHIAYYDATNGDLKYARSP